MTQRTVLVTGGAGFIGSNFVRLLIEARPEWKVVNLDALTYAGNLENLTEIEESPRYTFVHGDITRAEDVALAFDSTAGGGLCVVHFAAESHVDRSIESGLPFIEANVKGTQVLLDVARERGVERLVHVSTDEVYGSLGPTGTFTEETPLAPNSPYAASKTASDLLVRAAVHTHGFPGMITRCSNNYGPYQFPEKLIPLMIMNALEDKQLPVYGDGKNVRDWIYVADHCKAILAVMERGRDGEVYNIGGKSEKQNIEVVKTLLATLGKGEELITYVKDRPGHDLRYAIDNTKIRTELGWEPEHSFEVALQATVDWYLGNREWCDRVRSGAYREYYEKQYELR